MAVAAAAAAAAAAVVVVVLQRIDRAFAGRGESFAPFDYLSLLFLVIAAINLVILHVIVNRIVIKVFATIAINQVRASSNQLALIYRTASL